MDLDAIEKKLFTVIDKPLGTPSGVTVEEINYLCDTVKEIYLSQPVLLELKAPLTVVGDIHGQFHDLIRIFEASAYPPNQNFLFMGDYVDRGKQSIETVCLLFIYKIKYPEHFYMLRGNHECTYINRMYGFYDECCENFNFDVWRTFSNVFNCLPIAAIIEDKIFCVHGGISPELHSLDQIKNIERPFEIPEDGLIADLLWSDPSPEATDWEDNDRGVSYCFGSQQVEEFNAKFGFDLVCRAHQAIMDGFEFPFPESQCLVTVFSAPNYCNEYENKGAIMVVEENLFCSFTVLQPKKYDDDFELEIRAGSPPRGMTCDRNVPIENVINVSI